MLKRRCTDCFLVLIVNSFEKVTSTRKTSHKILSKRAIAVCVARHFMVEKRTGTKEKLNEIVKSVEIRTTK